MTTKAERADAIAYLRSAGKSMREIAKAVGIGKSSVFRYIKLFGMAEGVPKCPHCGLEITKRKD